MRSSTLLASVALFAVIGETACAALHGVPLQSTCPCCLHQQSFQHVPTRSAILLAQPPCFLSLHIAVQSQSRCAFSLCSQTHACDLPVLSLQAVPSVSHRGCKLTASCRMLPPLLQQALQQLERPALQQQLLQMQSVRVFTAVSCVRRRTCHIR